MPTALPPGGVGARVDAVAVVVVFLEADRLSGQLAPAEVPEHAQVVIYPLPPRAVPGLRVVGALAGEDLLALLGELLDLAHDAAGHRCLPTLAPADSSPRLPLGAVIYNSAQH